MRFVPPAANCAHTRPGAAHGRRYAAAKPGLTPSFNKLPCACALMRLGCNCPCWDVWHARLQRRAVCQHPGHAGYRGRAHFESLASRRRHPIQRGLAPRRARRSGAGAQGCVFGQRLGAAPAFSTLAGHVLSLRRTNWHAARHACKTSPINSALTYNAAPCNWPPCWNLC